MQAILSTGKSFFFLPATDMFAVINVVCKIEVFITGRMSVEKIITAL